MRELARLWWCWCWLALWPAGAALARGIVIETVQPAVEAKQFVVEARARLALDSDVLEALDNGIELVFELDCRLSLPRRYWLDETVAESHRRLILARHALSQRYTLQQSGSSQSQTFKSSAEALEALGELTRVLEFPADRLRPGTRYNGRLRLRLSVGDLPAPLRPLVWISPSWWLSSGWREWTYTP